eukprot:3071946-Amphidinium_carterae.1
MRQTSWAIELQSWQRSSASSFTHTRTRTRKRPTVRTPASRTYTRVTFGDGSLCDSSAGAGSQGLAWFHLHR